LLEIRDDQWAAFEADAAEKRIDQLAAEMRTAWPDECKALGAGRVRPLVAQALERARAHGFTTPAQQGRWVHLTFTLGPDLETAPATPWVAVTLGWDAAPDQKLDALERAAQDHQLARGAG
jgi:hypothetical protein